MATVPNYVVDPFWPKPLPNNWIIGQVSGVAVDKDDNVWIVHRPNSITNIEAAAAQEPPLADSCYPAPPIIQFDPEGNVLRAWGDDAAVDRWPNTWHGIFIDHESNVWFGSNGREDQVVIKSTMDGKRLMTLGVWGETGGSNDLQRLGQPADITVDAATNEVYLADGYGNRRVIVFDATSGAYKRHWGAYGGRPEDGELPPYDPATGPERTFRNPVHAVRIANDGLVYVTDRIGDRIQVFQKDGTYVKEVLVAPKTLGMGSAFDVDFSPDPAQTWLFMADGMNKKVWILERSSLEIVGHFGRGGRWAGCFEWLHNVCSDSRGNLYTAEVNTGKRVQKFVQQP